MWRTQALLLKFLLECKMTRYCSHHSAILATDIIQTPMKIAVFGAQGRLGQELTYHLSEKEYEVIPLSRFNADIENPLAVSTILSQVLPDIIINAAAITEMTHRMEEQDVFQANTVGAAHIALFAQEKNIPLIHISCASVLAGSKDKTVKAKRSAIEVIGQSKLEAEEIIEKLYEKSPKTYLIIRAGLLFGSHGFSLVSNLERLIERNKEVTVVNDVFYSLTSTKSLVEFIEQKIQIIDSWDGEIIHYCAPERLSVFELAEKLAKTKEKQVVIHSVSAQEVELVAGDFSLVPSVLVE